jgi:hypothetical protein
MNTPSYWFKTIDELTEFKTEPDTIEYLKIPSGETYIHTYGTVFWSCYKKKFDIELLQENGVTHWRIPSNYNEYHKLSPVTRKDPDVNTVLQQTPVPLKFNPEFVNI